MDSGENETGNPGSHPGILKASIAKMQKNSYSTATVISISMSKNDTNLSKKTKKGTTIIVDREMCIGAAPCVAVAPGVFQLDEEGKAYIVAADGADEEMIRMAAESCPVLAIKLLDEKGKQIYPKE